MDKFKIAISPYAKNINQPNPKNWPFFPELISLLRKSNNKVHVTQIGLEGEKLVPGVNHIIQGLPIKFLISELQKFDIVISVDNMIQHLCWSFGIPCVCIFTVSDSEVFGHPENTNIIKDRKYISKNQFDQWKFQAYNKESFIDPEEVVKEIHKKLLEKENSLLERDE
jgi:ADP-heptose:LPS heptosyltransferase